MMRKTTQMLLSAATGAALMLMACQPRLVLDGWSAHAAAGDAYRQLTLFGEVFERVRTQYVEKPDDNQLIEMAHLLAESFSAIEDPIGTKQAMTLLTELGVEQ